MEQAVLIEKLTYFGLTRQEAMIYISLLKGDELTGYEISKLTGISRSNVYSGLAGLVEKGAAYVIEGAVKKYTAVEITEFCDNKINLLVKEKEYLKTNMPEVRLESEGYITIEGHQHILDKLNNMISHAEQRVYLYMNHDIIESIMSLIENMIAKGIKVVIITNIPIQIQGAIIYSHKTEHNQIQVISDSKYVLTGELYDACLYSGQKNFVKVYKESLANIIKLIELT